MRVAVVVAAMLALGTVSASAQDVTRGEQVFKKCVACHSVGENAKNKVGPVLNNVFGRTAGTLADYKYSKAMIAAGEGGLVWTHDVLFEYLHKPNDMVKGTKMAFAGIKSDEEINDLLAYLQTFSPDYVPVEGEDEDEDEDEEKKDETSGK